MRILNRPMFKYGGPIKEGVMHGMRNNYQSGQLVQPGPGRPGYQGKIPKSKLGIAGWLGSKIPFFKQPISKISTGTKDLIPRMWSKIKPTSVPKYKSTGQLYKTPFVQSQIPAWKRGLSWMKANPWWTASSALYGGAPAVAVAKGSIPPIKAVSKTIADVAVPDWIYNWETGRWFNPDDTDLKPEDKKILKEKIVASDKPDPDKVIDPDAAARLAKETQNKRIKSYLDMMGYDQAKKGALSKALIDASAIVQQGTEEAGSLKEANWSKLINQAIQTTSKRLEKPEQIREAVGLMATKAAIEKDLEDPQVKKLRALEIEKGEKGLDPSPADLALAASGKTGKVTQDILENIVRSNEGVENFKASFKNKKGTAYYDWLDDNKNASEMKFMKDVVSKESDFSAGFYVFPDRIVEVKDDLTMKWYY